MPFYYFVSNPVTSNVLDATNVEPGTKIIIMGRESPDADSQLWEFEDGFLTNRASGYVLEAPIIDGNIEPGTELIQVEKRGIDNANQRWKYEQYKLISEFDNSLCIWGKNGSVSPGTNATVDTLRQGENTQRWLFFPA